MEGLEDKPPYCTMKGAACHGLDEKGIKGHTAYSKVLPDFTDCARSMSKTMTILPTFPHSHYQTFKASCTTSVLRYW